MRRRWHQCNGGGGWQGDRGASLDNPSAIVAFRFRPRSYVVNCPIWSPGRDVVRGRDGREGGTPRCPVLYTTWFTPMQPPSEKRCEAPEGVIPVPLGGGRGWRRSCGKRQVTLRCGRVSAGNPLWSLLGVLYVMEEITKCLLCFKR